MDKSLFTVPGMDCAAEENLIRMRLGQIDAVRSVEPDLARREVTVFHEGAKEEIAAALDSLKLGASPAGTVEVETRPVDAANQRRILLTVLLINLGFFFLEATTGLLANSMGLVADSLDMLSDALVYGLSLVAVGASLARKKTVAKWSGYLQIALAVTGFIEVLRRFFGFEALPDFRVMVLISALALAANTFCLLLLRRTRNSEAHIQASMIFTSNDIVINIGVIAAGLLVAASGSGLPDLIAGGIVFLIVMRGALRILALAK